MSRTMLQLVGGAFYLLNKVFLNWMERCRGKDDDAFWRSRRWAWIVYLVGLPPIVMLFFGKNDRLFGWIEIGGAPAMIGGLIVSLRRKDPPKWLDWIAVAAVPVGLASSLYVFHGLRTFEQCLEMGGSLGFLVGTYQLRHDRSSGYKWFLLMNVTTAWLLYLQGYTWFVPQQILSVLFIWDARRIRAKKDNERVQSRLVVVKQ